MNDVFRAEILMFASTSVGNCSSCHGSSVAERALSKLSSEQCMGPEQMDVFGGASVWRDLNQLSGKFLMGRSATPGITVGLLKVCQEQVPQWRFWL